MLQIFKRRNSLSFLKRRRIFYFKELIGYIDLTVLREVSSEWSSHMEQKLVGELKILFFVAASIATG